MKIFNVYENRKYPEIEAHDRPLRARRLLSLMLPAALREGAVGIGWRTDDEWYFRIDRNGVRRSPVPLSRDMLAELRNEAWALANDESDPASAGRFHLALGDRLATIAVVERVEASAEVVELLFEGPEECVEAARVVLADLLEVWRTGRSSSHDEGTVVNPEAKVKNRETPWVPSRMFRVTVPLAILTGSWAWICWMIYVIWHVLRHGDLPM